MKIDSILHFMVCYFIADVVFNFLPIIGVDPYWQFVAPRLIAVAVACLIGFGKELWDKYIDKESISASDLTWDAVGAFSWLFIPLIAEIMPWIPNISPLLP